MRKQFTSKIAKQFEEIFCAEKKYLRNYQHCDFYNNLAKATYSLALHFAIKIYNSKIIASKEKKYYISSILKYPLSLKEVIKMKERYHFIMYGISKIPTANLKMGSHKIFDFLSRLKALVLNYNKINHV
jgi:methyltransferase-like protein